MRKTLSLILAVALVTALAVPALAVEVTTVDDPDLTDYNEVTTTDAEAGIMPHDDVAEEINAPIPRTFVGDITVDGVELNLMNVPGAPAGYIPMRAFCEASGAYVDWFAEENEAFFTVDGMGVVVDLGTLAVTCNFEAVEGVRAYLDPTGYTFLPVGFLATFPNIQVDDHPEMDSVHFDFITVPQRTELEALADAIAAASEVGSTIQLSADDAVNFGIDEANFTEIVALYPMMSANVSSVYVGTVAEGKMDAAKADFAYLADLLRQNFGNYPACAEMLDAGQTVVSGDGNHILLLVAPNVEAGVELFNAAFPQLARPTRG